MTIMSTLNLSTTTVTSRRLHQPAEVHLPEFYAVCAWLNSSIKHARLSCRIGRKQLSKLTECRGTYPSKKSSLTRALVTAVASLDASQVSEENPPLQVNNQIEDCIEHVKSLLTTSGDGRISVSPYDTSIVALIKDLEGRDAPQIPSCLEWIARHQKADGSWGDDFFCIYDRILNTLACVVALKSWNLRDDMMEKGVTYINENVHKLKDGNIEHMTSGFEIVFPALVQRAKNVGVQGLPYDHPLIKEIASIKEERLKKIPKDMIYQTPTSLLYSLEGIGDLEWENMLKLQSADGSFLTSPSSTAYVFMHTKDQKCFDFIQNAVKNCNGAPHTYPVDIFARLWAIDRLQRLGISRLFPQEIKTFLDHIKSVWTEKGVFSGRGSQFCEIDCTSMGVRLLRLHGYNVDPNVLEHFKQQDGKFSCYSGQMIESASPIYNLYRAAQLRFPGEEILEEASQFAYNFLQQKISNHQLQEKWVIYHHFIDEVKLGLKMPWYATLPRVEAAYYLQHYAGSGDVWIGKVFYRMPEISNDRYKELAILDFNRCQAQHQLEWTYMLEWYHKNSVCEFGISKRDLLRAYFLAAATIFEPERTQERLVWTKTQIVSRMITSFLNHGTALSLDQITLVTQIDGLDQAIGAMKDHGLAGTLLTTFQQLLDGFDRYTRLGLKNAWSQWILKLQQGEANSGDEAELLANTVNICTGLTAINGDVLSHLEYTTLSTLTNKICKRLSLIKDKKTLEVVDGGITDKELEQDTQALVKLALEENGGCIDRNIKQTFLSVFKTCYYSAYHDDETIDVHIFKVLFEPAV
ncbi:copalyl diphosphate synthase 2, chloroplastic-like isoform X2 [Salvia splendens]|uniref:copalyl diphosphate synthase 2, chloroplastic-like isoform X2 n=1 Tax=Salvia splendens TaxID=180675 RepID=UPI001C2654CD|nr:copalyl diphosphate synthase 2, chloroplastic-like isoform X2 [Salvia splendens]